ncbi:tRNA lysidine(34) synthetase TilS [Beggiatoa leptomitoformis]|uniref:tRNA(Ile)-lysidine synthase n=1 Tax=Beggiatoa leptomitoformis TaxID=288004 RepID=A0A650GRM9_9GAMM|nr:tRNA lysidine(34) synthetase TilS [Beggiatoa leptomitoformis]ALG68689.1 tRNA lysidine(34) synthetase TilS [Beggiatoa leptomitoformis]QGX04117.1 tRNA lysidine(34) synthetase TilS [Beggiatoa leptomitoformis]
MTDPFLARLSARLQTYRAVPCWWVAYSGGLDSSVLLQALACLRTEFPQVTIRAIHIHHGLNPAATDWVQHCQSVCQTLAIECVVRYVNVQVPAGESLEACAREARYRAFTDILSTDEVLLTAQHADDQAETVLLQLLRGAGTTGLAAMPMQSHFAQGYLYRPLLDVTRATLEQWAKQQKLTWVNDSSNDDTRFTRNFLRHDIIPRLQQRWTSINQTLCRVAQHQAEADALLQELAIQDLQTCKRHEKNQLTIPSLIQLSPARQRNVLRYWLQQLDFSLPSTAQLAQITDKLLTAKTDAQPLIRWQGVEIRRYQAVLYALSPLPPVPTAYQAIWQPPTTLSLPLGKLTATATLGQGIKQTAALTIRLRQGGESCYLRGLHREVKTLLQAEHIPAWLRPFFPLIYVGETLAAIPMIAVCDGFQAQTGEKGWNIAWQ